MADNGVIRLSDLMSDVRETTCEWLQYEIMFSYKPSAMTPEYFERARVWSEKDAMSEAVTSMVFDILVKWSLVDDNHIMVPITKDQLRKLPNELLWAIHNAAIKDLRPKVESGPSSNGTSSTVATSA